MSDIPKLRKTSDGRYIHWCPGCRALHQIAVEGEHRAKWTFNGNLENPTFGPSVLIYGWENVDPGYKGHVQKRCHYFIVNGQIQFCSDSEHEFAGKTVPLPEPEY